VLSLPIPLRLLPAAEPELVTPVLQVVQLMVTRHLLGQAGLKANESHGGTLTLIQRFGSAAYLKIYLHCVVLVGVYRVGGDAVPAFVEVAAPTVDVLHVLPAGDTFMLTDWACKARHDMFLFWATRYTAKPMLEGGLPRLPLVRRRVRGGCLLMEHH
jgi:hypothetical protein